VVSGARTACELSGGRRVERSRGRLRVRTSGAPALATDPEPAG
jgi:hypothetical protein